MTLYKIENGDDADATQVMSNLNIAYAQNIKNLGRSLQDRSVTLSANGGEWAEAYIDANGRLNSVTGVSATFDTDKYKVGTTTTETIFIVIEATSLTTNWGANDCVSTYIGDNKWAIYCTSGTDEVKRAQIHKSLWYGTDGSNAFINNFTGVTAVKSKDSRDIGRRAVLLKSTLTSADSGDVVGTFSDTSTNTSCSSWSIVNVSGTPAKTVTWELPTGTALNQVTSPGTSNELGTDTSADEADNPATCKHNHFDTGTSTNSYAVSLVLCKGTISWVASGTTPPTLATDTDYYVDDSIPLITDGTGETIPDTFLIRHTIPSGTFKSTLSSAVASFVPVDWEAGADVQYKLTNSTEDTGWLETDEVSEFTAFTAEPDTCIVKLIPKTTSPTAGYPSISSFGVLGEKP